MWHDGLIKEYEKYKIPQIIEKQWDQELIENKIEQLKSEKGILIYTTILYSFCQILKRTHIDNKLEDVFELIKINEKKFDTFTKLRIVEEIRLETNGMETEYPIVLEMKKYANELIFRIIREPIILKENTDFIPFGYDGKIEEYLRDRILRNSCRFDKNKLYIGETEIKFSYRIPKIILIKEKIVIFLFDEKENNVTNLPINNIYVYNLQGLLEWNIKDILETDELYVSVIQDTNNIVVTTFMGIAYLIDIDNKQIIKSRITK